MHTRRWSLLSAVLALAGCQKSALNPNDPVTLDGVIKDNSGAPRSAVSLSLVRYNPAVVGGTCVHVATPDSTSIFAKATTNAQGKYHFDMKGSDTQTSDQLARCFDITNPSDAAGRSATVSFIVQVTGVELPDLQLWDSATSATLGAGAVTVGWKSLAQGAGVAAKSQQVALQSTGPATNATLWAASATGDATSLNLPTYLLEDQQAKALLSAGAESKGSGVIFQLSYEGESVNMPAPVGVAPPSRGATCVAAGVTLPSPCPFTDGKFTSPNVSTGSITLTLATPLLAKRALLRNLTGDGQVVVESSADGTTFTEVGRTTAGPNGAYIDLSLSTAAEAKYYRLRSDSQSSSQGMIRSLSQVSLLP